MIFNNFNCFYLIRWGTGNCRRCWLKRGTCFVLRMTSSSIDLSMSAVVVTCTSESLFLESDSSLDDIDSCWIDWTEISDLFTLLDWSLVQPDLVFRRYMSPFQLAQEEWEGAEDQLFWSWHSSSAQVDPYLPEL